MARRYVNPSRSATAVNEKLLDAAREKAAAAAARLRRVEGSNPALPNWDAEYEAAAMAARATARRAEALERLVAAQVERGGKREAAAAEMTGDLKAAASALGASRDQVAAAAAGHLRALAGLARAVESHNMLLTEGRSRVAAAGLQVRDDLVDEGEEHAEGVLDSGGLRAGGVDWTPIPPGGIEAHALRLVFAALPPLHPLRDIGKYRFRAHEVEARADGLAVPVDAGVLPAPPPRITWQRAELPRTPPGLTETGGYYPARPNRRPA